MIVLSCQFILLFGILKILSGKKSLQEWKKNLKINIQRHRWLLRLAPSTSLIYNNWRMKLMLKYKYILHCILTNIFWIFFTASMFKNKNVSLTFFQSDSNYVVWTKCTILLCIKDRFVQELVQTSQKKFSPLSILMVCVD